MDIKQKYLNLLVALGISLAILLDVFLMQQTTAQSSPMDTKEQITAMVVRQARAWESQDARAIVNDFAPNATFIAAGFRFEGKGQIKNAARDYFKQFDRTSVKIKRIIVDGNQGAVEWNWQDRNRQTGKEGYAEDAIVFELVDEKIVYWREYIEKKKKPL